MIDTHMHLDDDLYEIDAFSILNRSREKNIEKFILGSATLEENLYNEKIANLEDDVYFTCGYHPSECNSYDLQLIEDIIKRSKKVVGVGEIGLDFHYGKEDMEKQLELFKKQLSIAEKYNLPVVIHTRDAMELTYEILKEYKVKGVIHCFCGSVEMAKKFIDLGFYLGIGGVVTFKNSKLIEVIRKLGIDNIVLETDSPYLSPIRGEVNYPENVILVAKFLADHLNISLDVIKEKTNFNAVSLFKLNEKK